MSYGGYEKRISQTKSNTITINPVSPKSSNMKSPEKRHTLNPTSRNDPTFNKGGTPSRTAAISP